MKILKTTLLALTLILPFASTSYAAQEERVHKIKNGQAITAEDALSQEIITFEAGDRQYNLSLGERIPVKVFHNGSRSNMGTYKATVNGRETHVVLGPDGSIFFQETNISTGYTSAVEIKDDMVTVSTADNTVKAHQNDTLSNTVDVIPGRAKRREPESRGRVRRSSEIEGQITIDVYVANDIKDDYYTIFKKSYSSFTEDLEAIQEIYSPENPLLEVYVYFYTGDESPLLSFDYEKKSADEVLDWFTAAEKKENADFYQFLTKKGLDNKDGEALWGLAWRPGSTSWAKYNQNTPKHELGHNLNAIHENGEVWYRNGWWCQTVMHKNDGGASFRSGCDDFTKANNLLMNAEFNRRFN